MAEPDDVELRIARAREADTPVVLRMIQALVTYERLTDELTVTEGLLREALFGARPAAEVVVGYVGAEPVGMAVYYPTFSTASRSRGLFLEDLYVQPAWRGRGIGRRLFAHVASLAAERGGGEVSWSVLSWNEAAIGFYRALGAEPVRDSIGFRFRRGAP